MDKNVVYDKGVWITGQPLLKQEDKSLENWLFSCGYDTATSMEYIFDEHEQILIYNSLPNSYTQNNYLASVRVFDTTSYVVLRGLPSLLMFIRDYCNPIVIKSITRDFNTFVDFVYTNVKE